MLFVTQFLKRPVVLAALSDPTTPSAVLNFWMGVNCQDLSIRETLNQPSTVEPMMQLYYSTNPAFDAACQKFLPLIHKSGNSELLSSEWGSPDGTYARILMADQLTRNSFRGSNDAFKYDHVSLSLSQQMVGERRDETLSSCPAGYMGFIAMPLMHSEELADHDLFISFIDECIVKFPAFKEVFVSTKSFDVSHRNVVKKFGRYPHRNKVLGRVSTAEEEAWLKLDDLPSWAKV